MSYAIYKRINENINIISGSYSSIRDFVHSISIPIPTLIKALLQILPEHELSIINKLDTEKEKMEYIDNNLLDGKLGYDDEVVEKIAKSINSSYKVKYDEENEKIIVFLPKTTNPLNKDNVTFSHAIKDKESLNKLKYNIINSNYKKDLGIYYLGKLIGAIFYEIEENDLKFDIALLPKYQGKGLYSFLISKVEELAKKNNAKTISSEVGNLTLLDTKKKLGFKIYKDSGNYFSYKEIK